MDAPYQLHVTSGRTGIALALAHTGISGGHEVLIPAFHRESMIAPVHWTGAKPIFFKVNRDTSIDLYDIGKKITPRTKAILATHYFGFPQNLRALQTLCTEKDIVLIEDCAHTFFGGLLDTTVGQWGDYAIASSMKFVPVYDGGMLVSNSRNLSTIKLDTPALGFQLKALSNILEKATGYKHLGLIGKLLNLALSAKSLIWRAAKAFAKNDNPGISAGPSSADGGYGLDENWINKSVSWPSKKVIDRTDLEQLVSARRANYLKTHRALQNITGCHPLLPTRWSNTFGIPYLY